MSQGSARKSLSAARDACVSCGICTDACDLLGKERLAIGELAGRAIAEDSSSLLADTVLRCSLCGLCCVECPSGLDSKQVMLAARETLACSGAISPLGYEGLFTGCEFNVFTDYKLSFSVSFEDLARKRCDTVFFPGCALSAYSPELVRQTHGWLERCGTVAVIDSCCGAALTFAGLPERSADCIANLMGELATTGATALVTSCPNCFYQLKGRLGDVEVVSLSSLLREARMRVSGSERLTVHDSCPDRFDLTIGNDVRGILSGYELVEMEHSGARTTCCGSGGLVSSADPGRCADLASIRTAEFEATGAEHLVTACMNCAHRLNGAARVGEVMHYLELVFDVGIDWVKIDENLRQLFESGPEEESQRAAPAYDGIA